ncbi:MAG: hypothetical protein JWP67_3381 [Mucilaginibacter sp.]|nr:hypothetical protein [Mucilaginibacter sp.]
MQGKKIVNIKLRNQSKEKYDEGLKSGVVLMF